MLPFVSMYVCKSISEWEGIEIHEICYDTDRTFLSSLQPIDVIVFVRSLNVCNYVVLYVFFILLFTFAHSSPFTWKNGSRYASLCYSQKNITGLVLKLAIFHEANVDQCSNYAQLVNTQLVKFSALIVRILMKFTFRFIFPSNKTNRIRDLVNCAFLCG